MPSPDEYSAMAKKREEHQQEEPSDGGGRCVPL